ncbi:3-keto-disaccharide hydrolase [Fodinibius sediminis]|uniref:3-keto-alpha-glucoside-1,2-lyase/3-keto-2-hydroxy-glucal hydratase domain-containing protein n=1 Tax=Fodinibius sediminis TaxID=1214077 RepID=A0A521BZV8_9BACT|nr:DUF1080 domain-containing protein [Fodinibius sediminis]SMO52717.1 protein of unknown function [Fodinibius sediminis]
MEPMRYPYLILLLVLIASCGQTEVPGDEETETDYQEEGYTALYSGNLSQWKGQISEDPRKIQEQIDGLSEEEQQQLQAKVDSTTFEHWYIQDGMILYDGTEGVGNIETRREYGDFALALEWKIGPKGDSGIYLRNMPQVQIWDPHHQGVGSGGLYNNDPRLAPLTTADKPVGEWNAMHMRMIGDSVWVTLNDQVVVDGEIMDNLWADYKQPAPGRGPIVLQSHGTPLWFRNVYIKELDESR